MNIPALAADLISFDSRWTNFQWPLTVGAGVVAGLGVVGTLHFLIRPRMTFTPPPTTKPRQETADPFVHGSAFEQRKAFRREGNPIEVMVVDSMTDQALRSCFVVNRCVGGLGLFAETTIEPGSQLKVRPTNAPPITPWVEVVVKSCRPATRGFEIGCQFVKTPPWAILLMFG
jgi:hypothetical protein